MKICKEEDALFIGGRARKTKMQDKHESSSTT